MDTRKTHVSDETLPRPPSGHENRFYFYVTATNTAQARQQAAYFAELIREVPYDCRPAVDFEQYGSLSKAELNAIALAFAETLESRTGITPVFYTNAYSAAPSGRQNSPATPCGLQTTGPVSRRPLVTGAAGLGFSMRTTGGSPASLGM